MRPIGIDLFAGAGGLSLGFEQAGFEVVAAVEIDPIHAAVHAFNFPRCAVLPRSVVGLTGEEIRRVAGIGNRHVDVVFGGAPCQGFSLIGHRIIDDPRNALVREFVRIVDELRPTSFVFENVKGLTVGKHRAFLEELMEAFKGIGYNVRSPWRVLDAAEYQVPQHRERLFLLGARKGRKLPDYPPPLCRPADQPGKGLAGPTCADALGDLPDADRFPTLLRTDQAKPSAWREPSAYAQEMRCLTNNAWHFGYPRVWPHTLLTSSARTEHSDISRQRFAETKPGTVEPISRFYKLSADGLSNTLRAGTDAARGAFTSPRPIHYALARCVTVREMARLHGFPDWFRFHETKWHGARQIGNAVPPPLARAVATMVIQAMGIEPTRPVEPVPLGDLALIYMDMGRAAKHFGVAAPNGKRDRKSGAKKRSQHQTELARNPRYQEMANAAE
ncbi:MAG TPA: DNA cytosine methyltransferase [Methylomirabilota bacterium]|nr:DNA cytosine methyltransferase [Methylomirabilota bacterium]